jgi:L-asparaginase
MKPKLPKVAVVGTGGSISTLARDSLDLYEYPDFGKRLEVDELLGWFPELASIAKLLPIRFRAISSSSITPAEWIALAQRIDALAAEMPELDGIVITHGTASLEETAYFLHLVTRVKVPVVLVASQRPPNGLSSDAGVNLMSAIRVAASPAARGLGVLVVLNDEVHCAREVTKTSNWRLHTFRTPDFGCLGHVDPDGQVAIYRKPSRRHAPDTEFTSDKIANLPRVDIVYSYAGADGALTDAAVAAGAKGIVLAGNAPGRPTALQRVALVAATRQGVAVVLSSRAGSGRVIPRIGDKDPGFIAADNLNPQKARVLTMLALAVTQDRREIQRMFGEY